MFIVLVHVNLLFSNVIVLMRFSLELSTIQAPVIFTLPQGK